MIDKLLDVLKLNGIGTDKNLGFGRFDYTKDTIHIKLPSFFVNNEPFAVSADTEPTNHSYRRQNLITLSPKRLDNDFSVSEFA